MPTTLQHSPLLAWWVAVPAAAVVLLVLARYLLALGGSQMDERRKRIRTANTILMMLVTPLVAYGFSVATVSRARAYVFVWVLICSLLFMIIMLALMDMLNSVRIHRAHVRELRRSMTAQALMEAGERHAGGGAGGGAGGTDGRR